MCQVCNQITNLLILLRFSLWDLDVILLFFLSSRLVPRNSDDVDYVYFHHARRCQTRVGRNRDKPGKHNVFVGGCDSHGRIIHEIHHILGKIFILFIQNLASNIHFIKTMMSL